MNFVKAMKNYTNLKSKIAEFVIFINNSSLKKFINCLRLKNKAKAVATTMSSPPRSTLLKSTLLYAPIQYSPQLTNHNLVKIKLFATDTINI